MREAFEDPRRLTQRMRRTSMQTIERANIIIGIYQAQGYTLTLRQLYYQFVRRNWIVNSDNSYDSLSYVISEGRLLGMIDWDAIEDRVRFTQTFGSEFDQYGFMGGVHRYYMEDIWADQPKYVQFLSEKDAVSNIMDRVCGKWRVPYLACRGYNSQTELYNMAKRLTQLRDSGKEIHIMHIGDHDPSGQDMTRDNEARLRMFLRDFDFEIERVALNMDQIRQFNPPPQPAKRRDSRYAEYVANFGTSCWELDALEPAQLEDIVSAAIEPLCDMEIFEASLLRERNAKNEIEHVGRGHDNMLEVLRDHHNDVRMTDEGDYLF